MIDFNTFTTPAKLLARDLLSDLTTELKRDNKVLLLLAGGSAVVVYDELAQLLFAGKSLRESDEKVQESGEKVQELSDNFQELGDKAFWKGLTVMPGDDRFNLNPQADEVNWSYLKKHPLLDFWRKRGVQTEGIVQGKEIKETVVDFAYRLRQMLMANYRIYSVQGLGSDGHTAGIFPTETKREFERLFLDETPAIFHDLDEVYRERITVTGSLLSEVKKIYVYATGESKLPVLNRLKQLATHYPDQKWLDNLHQLPALLLAKNSTKLYTDNNLN